MIHDAILAEALENSRKGNTQKWTPELAHEMQEKNRSSTSQPSRVVMRVEIERDALDQVEIYADWIAIDQPTAAERMMLQFHDHCSDLAKMPRIGSLQDKRFGTSREIRRLPIRGFSNYGIFY